MEAVIIATGSELTTGLVQDSNSKFLANNLSSLGYNVKNIYICNDQKADIKDTVLKAKDRANLIFITGGLGPTKDDLTKEAFAEALNLELKYSKEIENKLKGFFCNHNSKMTTNNLSQAYVPEGGEVIVNEKGTAPALKVVVAEKIFYLLPGVPNELKYIFENKIQQELKNSSINNALIKEFNFIGIGESTLAAEIDDLNLNSNLQISYQAGKAEVKLRLRIDSDKNNFKEKKNILSNSAAIIREKFAENLYGEDQKDIIDKLHSLLIKNKLKISTAESFTGGLIAERLTRKAGSSNFFWGSIVAYNEKIKKRVLNVNPDILKKYGVVSKECSEEMAKKAVDLFGTDISISTTGAAGPDSHNGKQAGTMFVTINYHNRLKTFRLEKNYGRELNRYYASQFILFECYKLIKKREGN